MTAIADLAKAAAFVAPRIGATEQRPFRVGRYVVRPRARIDATVRVWSTNSALADEFTAISPIDFAVGWGPLADTRLPQFVSVSQTNRWFSWRGFVSNLSVAQMSRYLANWHIVQSSSDLLARIHAVRPGELVTLRGLLVDIDVNCTRWRTSLVLGDVGANSCEIVWVESLFCPRRGAFAQQGPAQIVPLGLPP